MNLALGLIVLYLVGADGPSCGAGPEITYDVSVLTVQGLEWRSTFFAELQPVTSQGGGTVWTASGETARRLAELDSKVLRAPRMMAGPRAVAHISDRANRKVASGVTRLADGPFDQATRVAYTPHYEEIREGLALTLTGRKLDQGVLACMVVDETRVASVHQVALSESVKSTKCCATESGSCDAKVASHIEVPEVVHAAVGGEWLIPKDGALVVSLGVETTADAAGKAVVLERLVLIEAAAPADAAVERASIAAPLPDLLTEPNAEAPPAPAGIPMPMPAMPSRSLPQPLSSDGSVVPLPPLPEELPTPSSLPGSSEPCASPQGRGVKPKDKEPTTLDSASTRASFAPGAPTKPPRPDAGAQGRPYLLRFPINAGGLDVEVEVRMAPPLPLLEKLRAPAPPAR
jgi:hypothetical protein